MIFRPPRATTCRRKLYKLEKPESQSFDWASAAYGSGWSGGRGACIFGVGMDVRRVSLGIVWRITQACAHNHFKIFFSPCMGRDLIGFADRVAIVAGGHRTYTWTATEGGEMISAVAVKDLADAPNGHIHDGVGTFAPTIPPWFRWWFRARRRASERVPIATIAVAAAAAAAATRSSILGPCRPRRERSSAHDVASVVEHGDVGGGVDEMGECGEGLSEGLRVIEGEGGVDVHKGGDEPSRQGEGPPAIGVVADAELVEKGGGEVRPEDV